MIRGTNAEFRFALPYNFETEVKIIKIAFWQDGNDGPASNRPLPIIKIKEQCDVGSSPNEVCITLNQEETLRFTEKRKAKVQLRGTTTTGIPFASPIKYIAVYPLQDDSILDDEILPTPGIDGFIYLDGGNIAQ